jgi:LysM repeat protein
MSTDQRSPARVLAPLAIVAFGLALLLIVASSGGGDESRSTSQADSEESRDLQVERGEKRRKERAKRDDALPQDVYVVKTGDTLGSIAEKTGVPVEKLQDLNPELDPQALVSGQKIKLRE